MLSVATDKKSPSFLQRVFCMLSPSKRQQQQQPASPFGPPKPPGSGGGQHFEQVFRYLDEDGDGKISPSELRSGMRGAMGEELLSAEDAEEVVGSTDSDGDGLLGYDDFVRLVEPAGGEEERGRDLREAFGAYEMDGQGCITPRSLRRALRRLGEARSVEECRRMIRRYDLNGDGVLSFEEFKLMML